MFHGEHARRVTAVSEVDSMTQVNSVDHELIEPTKIVSITMRDGVTLYAALFLPKEQGRYPTLFAASPYRFDNDYAPAYPMYLWRETGPVAWYVDHGYAFLHMDVRGTGRSGGEYRFLDEVEQHDLYDAIEWIATQPWSDGNVGGIGQSYYAVMQWFMAIQNPPHLKCIAPYDGLIDVYRASAFSGGIPGEFFNLWYNQLLRPINQYPAYGPSRELPWDMPYVARHHTTYDAFWKERAAAEQLDKIKVPVYSIGLWTKVDLHLNGNIVGYQRIGAPKKLLLLGTSNLYAAVSDFSSVAFHKKFLLPFYDHYLKGRQTPYLKEPNVRYFVGGADEFRTAETWPPAHIEYKAFYLKQGPSGSITSLNDGALDTAGPDRDSAPTRFDYPNSGWRAGVVGFDGDGRPDPSRRVLTFTSTPLAADIEIAGPIKLVLYAASTNRDTDFVVKLYDQAPQLPEHRTKDIQPASQVITKGWLRASHRTVDPKRSTEYALWYTHADPRPLEPGAVTKIEVAVMPTAYRFKKGNRIRIDLANGDSPLTEFGWFHHEYTPDKLGQDTIFHSEQYPSQILLPVAR
jgi:predicted acyl esterase